MVESPLVTSEVTKAVKALGAYRRARGSALDLEALVRAAVEEGAEVAVVPVQVAE